MKAKQSLLFGVLALGCGAALHGCMKATSSPAATTAAAGSPGGFGGPGGPGGMGGPGGQGQFDADSGPHAAGKKVMVANGCFRCHAVNGQRAGGGMMAGGPGGPPQGMPPGGSGGPPQGFNPGPGGPTGPGGLDKPGSPNRPPPGAPPSGSPPGGFGGGGPGARGPDLGKVAQDAAHTSDWLKAYVLNAKSKKPDSKMPSFEGKIKDDDLKNLIEYLASLK